MLFAAPFFVCFLGGRQVRENSSYMIVCAGTVSGWQDVISPSCFVLYVYGWEDEGFEKVPLISLK